MDRVHTLHTLCACMLSRFSRVRLCDPMDYSPSGSSVHGILQARIVGCQVLLQGIFPTLRSNLSHLCLLHWRGEFFTTSATWEALHTLTAAAAAKSLQSCLTLCDPIDGSPSGSPVPGILQARVLEWGAIAFSVHTLNMAFKIILLNLT